jgi:crossover junction endodeoxyribonuclease RuvC
VRVFGIDPGSARTGYGCLDTDGSRHRLVTCGALAAPQKVALPEKLRFIHDRALVLGHARGVAVLAAVEAGLPIVEYTPAEIKVAVVGYGRAEKLQMQHMVKLLLGLDAAPAPHDAADALAIAICHAHAGGSSIPAARRAPRALRSWRHLKLPPTPRRQAP